VRGGQGRRLITTGELTLRLSVWWLPNRDARAVLERNIQANHDGSADQESGKVYRGQAAYKNYVDKKESQVGMNKYTGCVCCSAADCRLMERPKDAGLTHG
jgi:hypothetical protein